MGGEEDAPNGSQGLYRDILNREGAHVGASSVTASERKSGECDAPSSLRQP